MVLQGESYCSSPTLARYFVSLFSIAFRRGRRPQSNLYSHSGCVQSLPRAPWGVWSLGPWPPHHMNPSSGFIAASQPFLPGCQVPRGVTGADGRYKVMVWHSLLGFWLHFLQRVCVLFDISMSGCSTKQLRQESFALPKLYSSYSSRI